MEECECQKSCRANGTVHEDGATWEKGCQQCSCVHGEIECRPTPCAPVTCKNPVIPQGQCCPICLSKYFFKLKNCNLKSCTNNQIVIRVKERKKERKLNLLVLD